MIIFGFSKEEIECSEKIQTALDDLGDVAQACLQKNDQDSVQEEKNDRDFMQNLEYAIDILSAFQGELATERLEVLKIYLERFAEFRKVFSEYKLLKTIFDQARKNDSPDGQVSKATLEAASNCKAPYEKLKKIMPELNRMNIFHILRESYDCLHEGVEGLEAMPFTERRLDETDSILARTTNRAAFGLDRNEALGLTTDQYTGLAASRPVKALEGSGFTFFDKDTQLERENQPKIKFLNMFRNRISALYYSVYMAQPIPDVSIPEYLETVKTANLASKRSGRGCS